MRKRNKVAQLHRTAEHRKAMLGNMVTSLFHHEQITSTVSKVKAAQRSAEKLITRAKKSSASEADSANDVHNRRVAFKTVRNKEVLNKLFSDIAPRYNETQGGYTRIIKLGRRDSDNSEMAMLELVNKKLLSELKDDRRETREAFKAKSTSTKSASDKKKTETKEAKKEKK